MGKAILLVRVSTERQSFDAQEQELFNLALADGYTDSNIIPICEKESGIKLKEEERKGLNAMKELIESDSNIDCVYAWEISRIARKKKILFSILDYLTDRKIQLIIKDPYLKLLLPNGEIDQNAEMVFTLFAQMAESEMRNKAARFKRAKDDMKKNYQYTGGWLPLGYKVENGYIVIDEDNAELIRLLFSLYVEGVSTYKMSKELEKRGYDIKLYHIRHILANDNYCNGNYPPIISAEIWNRKCEVATKNNKAVNKSKGYYFGAKLIECSSCGRKYVANTSVATYTCVGKYRDKDCTNSKSISINSMDSLLWWIAKKEYAATLASQSVETQRRIKEELEIWNQKLNALDSLYEKNASKLKRLVEVYSDMLISKEEYQNKRKKIQSEKTEIDNDAINIKNEIDRLNGILTAKPIVTNNGNLDEYVNNFILPLEQREKAIYAELDTISDEEKYRIVHQYVKSVHIEHQQFTATITVNLVNYLGLDKQLIFDYNSRSKRDKAFRLFGEELEGYKYVERIKRKNQNYEKRKEYYKEYHKRKKGA